MAKDLESLIECPFYIHHGKDFISCEGLCSTGKTTHFFSSKGLRTLQLVNVCGQNGGKKCPYYRALTILYERGLRN